MNRKTAFSLLGSLSLVSVSLSAAERQPDAIEVGSHLGGQGNLVAIGAVALAIIGIVVVLDDDDDPLSV